MMVRKELDLIKKRIKEERRKLAEVKKEAGELFHKEGESVEKEFRKNVNTAVTAAFAFVIALAWKDVITESVNYLIEFSHLPQGQAFGFRIVSAIAVTFICVVGIMLIVRFVGKKKVDEKEVEGKQEKKIKVPSGLVGAG